MGYAYHKKWNFMKRCNNCKETKDFSLFFKDKGFKDGHASVCKICKTAKSMEWREKNREKYNASMRDFRANNKDAVKDIDLKRTHNISLEQYNAMLTAQDYKCKICSKTNTSKKRSFAVDHNHETGHVRALLCYGCNRALHTLETKNLLSKAQEYLINHSDPTGQPISKIETRLRKKSA